MAIDWMRAALREVISNCIYGVDINPLSVELCKVSLWMEALEPGKPLSFLGAPKIQVARIDILIRYLDGFKAKIFGLLSRRQARKLAVLSPFFGQLNVDNRYR